MAGDITQSIISATAGLTGVVIGGMITWAREAWRDRHQQVKEAHYLAIRVVCALDELTDKYTSVVGDDGREDEYRNTIHDEATPDDIQFPADVDWKSIPHDLMYRILSLKGRLSEARQAISAASEFASPPDYSEYTEARQEWFAKIGLDIIKITNIMRERYRIPYRDEGEWNAFQYLTSKLEKVRQRQKESMEAVASMVKDLERTVETGTRT